MKTPKKLIVGESMVDSQAATDAFLEKIKTITIGTLGSSAPCEHCGKPLSGHKLIPVMVRIERRRRPLEEKAFAA